MTFISKKTGQFRYFALQLGSFDWQGKDVLDFGGNIGNLLLDPSGRVWLTDFGLVKNISNQTMTMAGEVSGRFLGPDCAGDADG